MVQCPTRDPITPPSPQSSNTASPSVSAAILPRSSASHRSLTHRPPLRLLIAFYRFLTTVAASPPPPTHRLPSSLSGFNFTRDAKPLITTSVNSQKSIRHHRIAGKKTATMPTSALRRTRAHRASTPDRQIMASSPSGPRSKRRKVNREPNMSSVCFCSCLPSIEGKSKLNLAIFFYRSRKLWRRQKQIWIK